MVWSLSVVLDCGSPLLLPESMDMWALFLPRKLYEAFSFTCAVQAVNLKD